MRPWSFVSFEGNLPAASALSTSSSTRSLLSTPSARIASALRGVDDGLLGERLEEGLGQQHGVEMSSLMTRQPAFSSVNCGLNEKPSSVKKSIDLSRSFTGG